MKRYFIYLLVFLVILLLLLYLLPAGVPQMPFAEPEEEAALVEPDT